MLDNINKFLTPTVFNRFDDGAGNVDEEHIMPKNEREKEVKEYYEEIEKMRKFKKRRVAGINLADHLNVRPPMQWKIRVPDMNVNEEAFNAWKENSFTKQLIERLEYERMQRSLHLWAPVFKVGASDYNWWHYGREIGVINLASWMINICEMSFEELMKGSCGCFNSGDIKEPESVLFE